MSRQGNKIEVYCSECGKKLSRVPSQLEKCGARPKVENSYCSDACRLKVFAQFRSKGGSLTGEGYREVKISPDDFFFPMRKRRNYVLKHRLVMAKHLGRCLLPWEVVHHKNGIKLDNRIENLDLFPSQIAHYSQIQLTQEIKKLQNRVTNLEKENRLLQWQIKETKNGSPKV